MAPRRHRTDWKLLARRYAKERDEAREAHAELMRNDGTILAMIFAELVGCVADAAVVKQAKYDGRHVLALARQVREKIKELRADANARRESPKPIGPDSDTFNLFMNARADLDAKLREGQQNRHAGYEIWRNAWLACERAHGIRTE